ncbi:MAG: signal recognition particle protein [Rhodospirillaceae bacterium]|jgi:signal recognition particle subunit SRP54|nr:signal recognition particle protein [Rhodospirillaceae bacterium]
MFDGLSQRLGSVFDALTKRGSLKEDDVRAAMREVRIALLEADVALSVVKDFIEKATEKAIGEQVTRSVTPGQMVIKIVHDCMVDMLTGDDEADAQLNLRSTPPVPFLMVGLQGSGKTTTTAKIARHLQTKEKKRVLMASLDVYRPAAMEQLAALGQQANVITLPIVVGQKPVDIAKRAMDEGRKGGFDVVVLDTAGRTTIDQVLMDEVTQIRDAVSPVETLLVADAMTGQDAVATATAFQEKVGITGIALTRVDGDSRGGAALSMRAVTGVPIKVMGVGEKTDAMEGFHADRIAGRILGMGDVVSLVEKAAETVDEEEAERLAKRMMQGQFDLNDLLSQLRQLQKMGDMKGLLGMLPGMGKMAKQIKDAEVNPKAIKRQEGILLSMTPGERRQPALIKASRKKRIAAGSGMSVQDVNRLLKQHQQMGTVMKQMKKKGLAGMFSGGMPGAGLGGGLPGGMPQGIPFRGR